MVSFFCSLLQFSSVTRSCPTLCDPMNHSSPGLPVHHQLLEFNQTHVHWVGDAIQPSHPLLSPSPPAPNPPSIRVFSNESTPRLGWPNYWSFSSLLRSFLIYSPLFLDAAFKITLTAPFFTIYFICQCLPLHCNVISMKEPTGNGVWYYWCWTLCSFPNAVWIWFTGLK